MRKMFSAAVMALIAVAVTAPGVLAQGRTLSSSTYVTPFPEQNRYRLYVLGDSLGDGIWAGLYRAFKPDGNVDVVKKSRVSTGFVQTQKFDWNKRLATILATQQVHIAVIMVGASDMKPIRANSKSKWHKINTPEWRDIYTKRIDAFIKKLKKTSTAAYWVGLPIMRSATHNNKMQVMNEIFRERAFINGIKFIDTWNGFADQFGRFSAFGPDLTGQVRRLRAADGIHFTISGYRKLAHFVEREIRRDMRKARSERDIPLAGNEEEQTRTTRRPRPTKRSIVTKDKKPARNKDGLKRRPADIKPVYANKADTRSAKAIALPSADSTAAGIKLSRPKISQATLSAVSQGYSPQGEVIAGDIVGGVTALASISPISETNLAAAQRRLPLTQRSYYRVLVKGEELKAKPGRADDFRWQGG